MSGEEDGLFKNRVSVILHKGKERIGPLYLTPHTKVNPRWIKDLPRKVKSIKHLEDDIQEYFYDFGEGRKDFVNKVLQIMN